MYGSIQCAIDVAHPGDTIIIQPGIYREQITPRSSVRLTGTSRDECIIEWAGVGPAVAITAARDVELDNLTIRGRGEARDQGVRIDRASVMMFNCVIEGFGGSGVAVYEPESNVILRENIVRNHGFSGILFSYGSRGGVVGNQIENNQNSGIAVMRRDTHVTIRENSGTGNREYGIFIDRANGAQAVLENNTLTGRRGATNLGRGGNSQFPIPNPHAPVLIPHSQFFVIHSPSHSQGVGVVGWGGVGAGVAEGASQAP
jgi:nitrous oxidase accessory protein NosD